MPDMHGWQLAFHVKLSEPTVLLNRWQRMNRWARKTYQEKIWWLVRQAIKEPPRQPLLRARIHVVRGNPPPRPDPDGLIGGLKPLLDVLCSRRARKPMGLGFIVDDAPDCLESLTAESVTTKRGQGFTEVLIYRPGSVSQRQCVA